MQKRIEHLIGSEAQHICAVASEVLLYTTKEYTGMQRSAQVTEVSLWVILYLYTRIYYEESYIAKGYEHNEALCLVDLVREHIEKLDATRTRYTLWEALTAQHSILHNAGIPVFSLPVYKTEGGEGVIIPISDSTLLILIPHIQENIRIFPLTSVQNIALVYEMLAVYTVFYEDGVLTCFLQNLERKRSGRYYTPVALANTMAENAVGSAFSSGKLLSDIQILDNSCGTGTMLLAVASYATTYICSNSYRYEEVHSLLEKVPTTDEERYFHVKRWVVQNMIYGVDSNTIAIAITQYIFSCETHGYGMPYIDTTTHIKVGNGLLGVTYNECYKHYLDTSIRTALKGAKDTLITAVEVGNGNTLEVAESVAYLKMLYTQYLHHIVHGCTNEKGIAYTLFMDTVFHYELEFPEVFFKTSPGFTVCIGNPPWEKMKFEETLFWDQFHTTYGTYTETQKRLIREGETDAKAQYKKELQEYSSLQSICYRTLFTISRGVGDDNIFRYFIERAFTVGNRSGLLCSGGILLYIVPSGFITEESSATLRTFCFMQQSIAFFIGFENREKIFESVDSRYKFGIVSIIAEGPQECDTGILCMQTAIHSIAEYKKNMIMIAKKQIALLSPETYALPEIRSKSDIELLQKLYVSHPALDPTYITIRRELDCATHKDIFYEEQTDFANIPLYRGAMIWQYTSTYAPAKLYVSSHAVDALLQSTELFRFVTNVYEGIPIEYKKKYKYLGKNALVAQYLGKTRAEYLEYIRPERLGWRLALRGVARNTDERSVISSLLPQGSTYQNSLFASSSKQYRLEGDKIICIDTPVERTLYAIAVFNSLVYDWLMRCISAINISKVYIHRIPFPQPTNAELQQEPYSTLIRNTLQLQVDNHPEAFGVLAKECGIPIKALSAEEKEYKRLENDCIVASLYGITVKELEHCTGKPYFAVLHKKYPHYCEMLMRLYR